MKNFFATAASVLALTLATAAIAGSNDSTVSQIGIGNFGQIDQAQGPSANNDNDSILGQSGNYNAAYINQGGDSIRNLSITYQSGSNNVADIDQVGTGNDINDSYVSQSGNANYARANQGDLINNNKSEIGQYGNGNWATVNQGGANGVNLGDNKSYVYQYENNDVALVNQGGVGAVNTSTIVQDYDDIHTPGAYNYAQVTQNGSSTNNSGVTQYGDANAAYITQGAASGVTNNSGVLQSGTANLVSVTQH